MIRLRNPSSLCYVRLVFDHNLTFRHCHCQIPKRPDGHKDFFIELYYQVTMDPVTHKICSPKLCGHILLTVIRLGTHFICFSRIETPMYVVILETY